MRSRGSLLAASTALALMLAAGGPVHAVTIDWVTVGDPGNACDSQLEGCYGAVAHTYRISKYEITNAQYAEFLNAVADADPNGLYSEYMDLGAYPTYRGGITRSGEPGSYTYSAIAGRESMPVNHVSFWDSLRFANWLHNGQPNGAQGNATTEHGAYTLDGYTGSDGRWVDRNEGATIFLPSGEEWYKAAYYDTALHMYYDYPAGSDTETTCAAPGATPNTANCYGVLWELTIVGSYTGSASPNGTFDQGGNVWEWNEATNGTHRGCRGGTYAEQSLGADRDYFCQPQSEADAGGFRVAIIPEPSTGLLLVGGMLGLAAWRRR